MKRTECACLVEYYAKYACGATITRSWKPHLITGHSQMAMVGWYLVFFICTANKLFGWRQKWKFLIQQIHGTIESIHVLHSRKHISWLWHVLQFIFFLVNLKDTKMNTQVKIAILPVCLECRRTLFEGSKHKKIWSSKNAFSDLVSQMICIN